MKKEDIIIEAYELIKTEVINEYESEDFLKGVVMMAEACISMLEGESE